MQVSGFITKCNTRINDSEIISSCRLHTGNTGVCARVCVGYATVISRFFWRFEVNTLIDSQSQGL